jgi:hypothetical protein
MKYAIEDSFQKYLNSVWDNNPIDYRIEMEKQYHIMEERAKFLGIVLKDLKIVAIQQRIQNLHIKLIGDPIAIAALDLHLLNWQQARRGDNLSNPCLVLEWTNDPVQKTL